MDDEIKKLDEEGDYLRQWLLNFSTAKEVAPFVQKRLEQVEWEKTALENRPEEAADIPSLYLLADIDRGYQFITSGLPMIPEFNSSAILSSGSASASGTATVFEYVSRIGDISTPAAISYSNKYTGLYYDLQASQERPQVVRELLGKLGNPQTIERFDDAYNKFYSYKGGVGDKAATANSIRNLIEGVKGDLWESARNNPNENMTWKTMSNRLAKRDLGGEENLLIEQEAKRESLFKRLSAVLKDRDRGSVTNLEFIWTEVLDHIYIVLNLIREV